MNIQIMDTYSTPGSISDKDREEVLDRGGYFMDVPNLEFCLMERGNMFISSIYDCKLHFDDSKDAIHFISQLEPKHFVFKGNYRDCIVFYTK